MDDDLGEPGNPLQALRLIQVSKYGAGTSISPEGELFRVTHQCENAVVAEQTGQETAGNISTADDQ